MTGCSSEEGFCHGERSASCCASAVASTWRLVPAFAPLRGSSSGAPAAIQTDAWDCQRAFDLDWLPYRRSRHSIWWDGLLRDAFGVVVGGDDAAHDAETWRAGFLRAVPAIGVMRSHQGTPRFRGRGTFDHGGGQPVSPRFCGGPGSRRSRGRDAECAPPSARRVRRRRSRCGIGASASGECLVSGRRSSSRHMLASWSEAWEESSSRSVCRTWNRLAVAYGRP